MKRALRSLFLGKRPEDSKEDLSSLDEYEIYCSPLPLRSGPLPLRSASYTEGMEVVSSLQRGRQKLIIKHSDALVLTQEVFIRQPPSLIKQPIYARTMSGLDGTWRLAIDQERGRVYTTNNAGSGAYSILSLEEGEGQLVKTVDCQYIWNIRGIAVDDSENVYITGDHKVQKYNADGHLVASFGWYEPGDSKYQLNDPNGLTYYGESVYVCDSNNQRIQVLSADLQYQGSIEGGAHLAHPEDVVFDGKGRMHVLDSGNLSIAVFDAEGSYDYHIDLPEDETLFPVSLRLLDGNYYISDLGKSHIAVLTPTGQLLHKILVQSREELMEDVDGFVHVDSSTMQRPVGLAVDCNGYIYVSNIDSREIQVF